ncbi:enoyl-CoA hydratase [Phenylobacterium sp.]|uniref:enoyl-CoA hydratase n=1 Tax=Phenylobacterium sp. TaxID=1871053 RepID=UPI0035AF0D4E
MSKDLVQVDVISHAPGRVAWITINRPEKLNAMNTPLMEALAGAVEALAADGDLRALVLTGAGEKAFIGGADIDEMARFTDPVEARQFIKRVHRCCEALRDLPAPTIARINGYTFGGGLEVAAACDVRAAVDTAVFGMPEVRLGIPSVVEAALLPKLIGWGRTRELLLFGDTFTAAEAQAWGFVERIAPPGGLDAVIDRWLEQLGACTPKAVRLQKRLIRSWEDLPLRAAIAAGIDAFEAAAQGGEPKAAMADFLAHRAANSR